MYFSQNSRYVFSRANWLTPSSYFFSGLKGADKNLSVKFPKEDPSKPPLRMNIPKEHQTSDPSYSKLFQERVHLKQKGYNIEPRSRSVIPKSKTSPLSASLEDGLLQKSESAVQFSTSEGNDVLSENIKRKPLERNNSQKVLFQAETHKPEVKNENVCSKKEENDPNEGLTTVLNDKALGEALANNYFENQQPQTQSLDAKPQESFPEASPEKAADQKTLYIIIDVPEKSEEKNMSGADDYNEISHDSSYDKSYMSESQVPKIPKAKPNWNKIDSFKNRSKSLSKLSNSRPESLKKSESRFEIHEIDDAATYIFHLRFKKNFRGRPSAVGCVPEKEVNTRAQVLSYNDAPIRVRETIAGRNFKGFGKAVAAIEDFPELIKYSELKSQKKKLRTKSEDDVSSKARGMTSVPQSAKTKKELVPDEIVTPQETHQNDQSLAQMYSNEAYEINTEDQWNEWENSATQDLYSETAEVKADAAMEFYTYGEDNVESESSKYETQSANPDYNYDYIPPPQDTITPLDYSQYQHTEYSANKQPRISEVKKEKSKTLERKKSYKKLTDKKRRNPGIFSESQFHSDSKVSSGRTDSSDFKTCNDVINISSESSSSQPTKFSAAFPPILNQAKKNQVKNMGIQKESLFNHKCTTKIDFRPKDFEMNRKCEDKVTGLIENSLPKKKEQFDCGSENKKDRILNVTKEGSPKLSDNMVNVANEHLTENKGKRSFDSLTMMKKVKDIVDLDLNNAIKIFNQKESTTNQVKKDELKECMKSQKTEKEDPGGLGEVKKDAKSDGNIVPMYLPTVKENETAMKLDDNYSYSVVMFNPDTNEFAINKTELEKAISRKSKEPLSDAIIQKLEEFLEKDGSSDAALIDRLKFEMKNGDSILIYDEETQTWRVDYSILERREEQLRQEQELTRRSELILETFEKLEQGHVNTIPKPNSPHKRIFDYNKEEWKIYKPEKETSSKSKTKLPFKELDAEEIRKKNADMYEDLFVSRKKETTMRSGQEGLDPPSSKPGKSCSASKEAKGSGSSINDSGTTPKEPKPPIEKGVPEDPPEKRPKISGDDDNYWGSFLRLNILPKDISEIREIKVPPAPVKVPPRPTPPKKIEDPKTKTPRKKIEEPRFRIPLPFRGDKKIESSKPKESPAKGSTKTEDSKVQQKPPAEAEKKEPSKKDPAVKAPPPGPPPRKEDPTQKSPPTIGSPSDDPKSKSPPTTGAPTPDGPKSKPPPPPPPAAPPKTDPSVKSAGPPSNTKMEDPKFKTSPLVDKKDKSIGDHYISENIVEMSKNSSKEKKIKPNKIETVKLNITSDKRMPSKITEINLNKNYEEVKESKTPKKQDTDKKNEKCVVENKTFYQNFEKYKTPFSDPEYEEKSMKINSDMESNPNLKKLDNWSKTLVLHDIVKPPENIESWLKDETDKMATLLLKVLQEAADGKPKKKPGAGKSKSCDKIAYKGNPYDNIRKKQETTPEQFLFKVRSVNIAIDDGKKKPSKELKSEPVFKDIPVQSARTLKPPPVVDAMKISTRKETFRSNSKLSLLGSKAISKETKSKMSDLAIDSILGQKEVVVQDKSTNELTDEIPGPEILKKISNAWKMFPVLSCQMTIFTLFRIFQIVNAGTSFFSSKPEKARRNALSKLFAKYGPIVNIQGPLSGNVILIHKPEHLAGVFEQDTTTPVRSVFDSLDKSRKDSEDKLQNVGAPINWNKPEFDDLKKVMNDPLTKGCEKFFGSVELAGEALVSNIRRNRNGQNQVSEDFMEEIKRWSMEGLCNVLFEKTFSFLEGRSHNVDWVLEPEKLYVALDEATDCLSKCERGFQTWRLMATPSYIGLSQAFGSLSTVLSKQLYQAEMNLKSKNELLKLGSPVGSRDMSFAESMLLNDGMSTSEVTCNLIDIMLIGVNTMSSALGFLLYNLALNARVQNKLLKEVKEVLPDKYGRLDYHKLHSLKYLQACLKESLRLHTPIPIFFRVLQNDVLLSNYMIPKGTYVVMDSKISSMTEQIFDEPEKFNPDRWLSDEGVIHSHNPLFFFPFCHGPRAELAKRVAELQLWSCVTKVVRNFQIEYHYGEIQESETLISLPDRPLKLNFVERDE